MLSVLAGAANAQTVNSDVKNHNDGVVEVGYGTMRTEDITGSVSSVKSEDLGKVANANALLGLQAKVPGVDIQQVSGEAGAGISMLLRGYRSFMDNNPLIIVDGAEYLSVFDIPASEIESINILKDAASTAIYGSRGANGVVIVNTKRGKAGKIKVNLDANWSFNSMTEPVKGMYGNREVQRWIDSQNYIYDYRSGNWGQSNVSNYDFYYSSPDGTPVNDIVANGEFTDWLGLLQQNSVSQNYNVSVSGGNKKTNFIAALSLMDDRGTIKGDQFKRYTARVNADHNFDDIVKIGTNLSYTHKDKDQRNSNLFASAIKLTSLTHAYDRQTGDIIPMPDVMTYSNVSPLMDENGNYKHNIDTKHFVGGAYVQINFLKNLIWKTSFNLDYTDKEENKKSKSPNISYTNYSANSVTASNIEGSVTQYLLQNTASYDVNFGGMHDLNILIGNEYSYYKVDEVYKEISIYAPSDYFLVLTQDAIPESSLYEFKSKNSLLSFFGRLNYSYAGKYLFQATLRTDGFDGYLLMGKYKWSTYPSFSAGWRITEEKFMQKTSSWLNNLKLRLSWGVSGSGNNSVMAVTRSMRSLVTLSPQYAFPNVYSYISVPDLTCEKTSTFDAGLDFTLLNGRLGGSIDYYTSKSHDLIYFDAVSYRYTPMPYSTYGNVAKTKGHGLEIALNAVPVITKDFRWDVSASATFAKSEIVKLTEDSDQVISGTDAAIIGQSMSAFYAYETGNCWGVGEYEKYCADYKARTGKDFIAFGSQNTAYGTPGTVKVIDRNDDGKIDEYDRRVYDRTPKAILGMTNTFSYKNFSLSIQMMARLGGYMAYEKNAYVGGSSGYENWADVNYWTPSNTDTKIPSPACAMISSLRSYSYVLQYEKADYFKIKDITLSYNLEKNWLKSLRMENATVYCSFKNFITINALDDNYDPERGGSVSFPLSKQFVLGLNITF
ncbi:MAG: SusC/RagA family TonB-linked outer membrane protein [Prevotella sp.]|nr:SusC/RagA family TonB-linked outer membrane protein [Prevotella sp.]